MKNIFYALVLAPFIWSCNDGFLERYPLDEMVSETYWKSESDLKAYTSTIYTYVPSFSTILWDDNVSDNYAPATYNSKAAGLHTASTGTWDWTYLRKLNIFLDNYQKADIEQEIKDEYAGEVRFFRAWMYFDRVVKYGDVPWVDHSLNVTDEEILYNTRTPRNEVIEHIIEDLTFAVEHLPESREEGRVHKYTALHLKSRICLYEGTYRKYHNLGDPTKYLRQAAEAAETIMNSQRYELYSTGNPTEDYRNLWLIKDLRNNSEAILYRHYDYDLLGHGNTPSRTIPFDNNGLTKDMVDDYLCIDGKPIGLSPLYKGDKTLDDQFANRDPRMGQTIVMPGIYFFKECNDDEVVPRLFVAQGYGSCTSTGFHWMKCYNEDDEGKYGKADTDLPVFRYAETLLNYAEAKAELGELTQDEVDKSINLLRRRVGMAEMVIADLQRDPDSDMTLSAGYLDKEVSVLLEEIRRERRIELACEGFRRCDLLRWRAGKFYEKNVLGARWSYFLTLKASDGTPLYDNEDVGKDIFVNEDGYIEPYQKSLPSGRVFDSKKHYLEAIPLGELSLNPNLGQNPGW